MHKHIIAVDLGASSGRVILGVFQNQRLQLQEYHRFGNFLIEEQGHSCWDIDYLEGEIKTGINKVLQAGIAPDAIAIDTWGVDFVLTDDNGQRVGPCIAYRDKRTDGVMERFFNDIAKDAIYQKTGIQFLPFNTLYQLKALTEESPSWLGSVQRLQFIPDYLSYCLTGVEHCEYSNASTSQLINCHTKQWDHSLVAATGIPEQWLLAPQMPHCITGQYQIDDLSIPVISVASHDTASAVLAVPFTEKNAAYLSSGTWSLMGIERFQPITDPLASEMEFTNEGGAEGRFRILKNIMGLWLLQRVQAELEDYDFQELEVLASKAPAFISLINPDEQAFLNPTSMIEAIQIFCVTTGQVVPKTPGAITRCVLESLAMQYRKVYLDLNKLNGQPLEAIHIVGGGSKNRLLNQLCADACQSQVWTGPTEASAIGNLLGQLITLGVIADVDAARQVVSQSFPIQHYIPSSKNAFADHWPRFQALCGIKQLETQL